MDNLSGFNWRTENGHTFRFDNSGHYYELILRGYDLKSELSELSKRSIDTIAINTSFCEDRIKNLDFLIDYPMIKRIHILSDQIELSGIYSLPSLEELYYMGDDKLDYSIMTSLRKLWVKYKKGLSLPQNLEYLSIYGVNDRSRSLSILNLPQKIKELEITRANIVSLEGIPEQTEMIGVYYSRSLKSLRGLIACKDNLTCLQMENCPNLDDYSELEFCRRIEKLLLLKCHEIPSVAFFSRLCQLKHVSLSGTKVQDGNYSYLSKILYNHY